MYLAIPCQCGDPKCKSWQVRGIAPEAKFTRLQAICIASLLNGLEFTANTGDHK